ncbi:P-450 monoxygenase [Roseobacter sp. SK209-2-6]|uniref:cytochrome P450 n=1 Tax=Roseobacter sp. SK209-2-6 TaxID=388739 RepID=UPI0000F3D0BD|nr:cytochrome P450 [Roseobacter sp. SK209-2-6]EBA17145.1 P-450 monoxygenase [Roseobacter sp. SK209-2-6]
MPKIPSDPTITVGALHLDPYAVYRRLRHEAPVMEVPVLGRIFLTKATDIRAVKDNPDLFRSGGTETPMERAFQAVTLMRKDGAEHQRDRLAMAPAFSPRTIRNHWQEVYTRIANDCLDDLPKSGTADLFSALAAPFAARCLAHLLGIESASNTQLIGWSQALIDGAGNFAWDPAPFAATDAAHEEMNALFDRESERHLAEQGPSALSAMVNAVDPLELSQIRANLKIAIGGGINEPRDAFCTILFGLLQNPENTAAVKEDPKWFVEAFEEGVRWVAPIQTSSRRAAAETEIRGFPITKDQIVMTIQASAGHDEEIHENPEVFDLFRANKTHQSFASGPHFCQGTHVARMMVAQILLPLLFERYPNMSLADPAAVPWYGFAFRGPLSLPVTLA